MAYPTTFTSVAGTTLLASADHAAMHNAVETTVGTTAGTNVLKSFVAGNFPARINSGNVLQHVLIGTINNSILGTPSIVGGTVGTSSIIGGTFNNGVVGTPTTTGGITTSGTFNNGVIGTSAITGGTILQPQINAYFGTPVTVTGTAAGTYTFDTNISNEFRITMPAGNITVAFTNTTNKDGFKFISRITQDATGTRVITWPAGVTWDSGGGVPTLSAGGKTDCFGFITIGTAGTAFDGCPVFSNR